MKFMKFLGIQPTFRCEISKLFIFNSLKLFQDLLSNENCRGGYYSDTYKLCIFTQKSELKYIPVYTRQEAMNICYAKNATLPYSMEHVHALEELHFIRNEIGKSELKFLNHSSAKDHKRSRLRLRIP